MNVVCLRHTDLPGTTSLFSDLVYRYDRVSRFYAHPPKLDAARDAAAALDYADERRAALVEALRAQNADAGKETAENLELLSRPGTVVVATGQQVGLFGGPIFSLYKALTALKYAAKLRERGLQAVAVFWCATEDHDLDEVDHAWVFDRGKSPHRITAEADARPGRPVGDIAPTNNPAEALADLFLELPHGDEARERLTRHYRSGASLGAAFRDLFRDLFAPYGLITLDPMDPAIRRLAGPLLSAAVEAGPELVDDLLARGAALEEAGYHQQVKVDRETSLLFYFHEGKRTPIKRKNSGFSAAGQNWSSAELAARIADHPEEFSPNALLRPVAQDYLLPTAAFIGGPAELAYLAQSGALYERLLGRRPVMMPRASFTLLDSRAMKLLERYGLGVLDCLVPFESFKQRIAEATTPRGLQTRFAAEKKTIDGALEKLHGSLDAFDPTLAEAFEKSRRKIDYQLSKIEGKAARESLRRTERGEQDAAELAGSIFPHRTLQERFYSAAPFLAEHGDQLIADLYEAVKPECPDHQVLAL